MDRRRKSTFGDSALDCRAAERADAHHVSQAIERRYGLCSLQLRRCSLKVHGFLRHNGGTSRGSIALSTA